MRDRARALNQLQAAEFGNIIINEEKIIVIVAGKFIERAIAINAKLHAPFLRGSHVLDQFGYLLIVFHVQNGNLRRSLRVIGLYLFLLGTLWVNNEMTPTRAYSRSGSCLD